MRRLTLWYPSGHVSHLFPMCSVRTLCGLALKRRGSAQKPSLVKRRCSECVKARAARRSVA